MAGKVTDNQPNRPLRILMTADAVGGVWQYSVDLVRNLSANNCEVLVAVLGPRPSEEARKQLSDCPRTTMVEGDYKLEWMDDPWADVDRSSRWLLDLNADFGADLIHLNGYAHAALPWEKPKLVVAHSCVFSWWQSTLNATPDSGWDEYRRRVTAGLAGSDAVVAPSNFMAAELSRLYGVPSQKLKVIHNFSTVPVSLSQSKEPFCLAAGRLWDSAKNLQLLTGIAPRLKWPLFLAGRNDQPATGDAVHASLRMLGQLENRELLAWMTRASIFVHPAVYEPFGLAVLEAARSGCCLVLADTRSLRELWVDAAIFLDPREPDAWVSELNRLAGNERECARLGQIALAHAERYSASASVDAYLKLYGELMTGFQAKGEAAA